MKTLKLITDINITSLDTVIKSFEEQAKAEVIEVVETMHFNGIRKNFEIHTHITYLKLSDIELNK